MGDILGEALRADSILEDSEPVSFDALSFVVGPLAETLRSEPVKSPPDPWLVAVDALAVAIAQSLDVPRDDVLEQLYSVPDNMLCLLDSPQGWAALAEYTAHKLRAGSHSNFRPTIH